MATVLSPGQVLEPLEPTGPQEWRENLSVTMICPECREDPPNLVENFSAGDTVCNTCGLVLADRWIDERSEWRTFANDETGNDDPSRVGRVADPLLDGSQLETSISFGDGGQRSRELHRTHAKMINDKATKTLKEAYAHIAAICATLHLTEDAISYAQQLFKNLEDAKTFKGKNQQNTIAGCIFISCRRTKHKRTFKDITDATRVSKKDLGRAFKTIEGFFREQKKIQARNAAAGGGGMPMLPFDDNHPEVSSTDPADICERYCQRLLLNRIPTRVSEELAKKLSQGGALAGRSPLSAAAACIYMASHLMGQPKTPKEIAAVAGVSDGTIRTAYKLLYAQKDSLIDPKWLSEGGDITKLPSA